MAFKYSNIVGDGSAQLAFTTDGDSEGVIHNTVAYNTSDYDRVMKIKFGADVIYEELIVAGKSARLSDKMNVPPSTEVRIEAGGGLRVVLSYFVQAVDIEGALTVAQELVQDAKDEADRAKYEADRAELVNAEGYIDDDEINAAQGWSSAKTAPLVGVYGTEHRYDRILGGRDTIEILYDGNGRITDIRYVGDDPDNDVYYRDVMEYDGDTITGVKHYFGTSDLTTASGTTTLTYTDGKLISSVYAE